MSYADCSGCGSCGGCCSDWPSAVNMEVGAGFRRDKLKWSIAGPDDFPNVLSELEWKDVRMVEYEGAISYTSCRNYAIRANGAWGQVYHGRNIDSDYFGDDKTDLFSRSRNNAGKGSTYDIEAGVGYRGMSNCSRFTATPLIGYSYHGQCLHIYEGVQTFDIFETIPIQEFPIPGLNSTYKTRWFGPWVGMDFTARVETCAYVFGSFEWHLVSYRATGNWNLRPEVSPFEHRAHGFGYIARLGGNWELCDRFSIGILASYRNIRTRHGREAFTFKDPQLGDIRVHTRFNGAKWQAVSLSGIVAYRF